MSEKPKPTLKPRKKRMWKPPIGIANPPPRLNPLRVPDRCVEEVTAIDVFAAISNLQRVNLLKLLMYRSLGIPEIMEKVNLTRTPIRQHLEVLWRVRLITREYVSSKVIEYSTNIDELEDIIGAAYDAFVNEINRTKESKQLTKEL